MAIVLGQSPARKEIFQQLEQDIHMAGYKVEFDTKREIKKSRRRLMAKVPDERVIVLSKY